MYIISSNAMMKHTRKRRTRVQRPSPIRITPLRREVADRLLYDSACPHYTTRADRPQGPPARPFLDWKVFLVFSH